MIQVCVSMLGRAIAVGWRIVVPSENLGKGFHLAPAFKAELCHVSAQGIGYLLALKHNGINGLLLFVYQRWLSQ